MWIWLFEHVLLPAIKQEAKFYFDKNIPNSLDSLVNYVAN
jgi:hypothetical protein